MTYLERGLVKSFGNQKAAEYGMKTQKVFNINSKTNIYIYI